MDQHDAESGLGVGLEGEQAEDEVQEHRASRTALVATKDYTNRVRRLLGMHENVPPGLQISILSLAALWRDLWESNGEKSAAHTLFDYYAPFARCVARSVALKSHDRLSIDWCSSYAYTGLLDAISKYEMQQGPFVRYAWRRMTGEIWDGYRREFGREGKGSRQYEHIGIGSVLDENFLVDGSPVREDSVEAVFAAISAALPEEYRHIFIGYYLEGKTMLELSREVNLTESGVSYRHGRLIAWLRKAIVDNADQPNIFGVLGDILQQKSALVRH